MLALFTIIGAFAVIATIGATIGTRGRRIDVGCTRLVADEVITLTDAEIYHLLDDTQEIETIDWPYEYAPQSYRVRSAYEILAEDTEEITALGGF